MSLLINLDEGIKFDPVLDGECFQYDILGHDLFVVIGIDLLLAVGLCC